jgi:hypothetical protein
MLKIERLTTRGRSVNRSVMGKGAEQEINAVVRSQRYLKGPWAFPKTNPLRACEMPIIGNTGKSLCGLSWAKGLSQS